MLIEKKLEKLPNGAEEVTVTRLYKSAGDTVSFGENLFEVEANKVNMTIESDADGVIKSIEVEEGEKVKSGQVLAIIEGQLQDSQEKDNLGNLDYFSIGPKKENLECEIAIIGGGPGGYVAAIHAAKLGAKVILVEKDRVGGTCLNRGCIPTKAFVRSAEIYQNLKTAEQFGCYAENISLDMRKVIERKNSVVDQLVQGIEYLLEKNNIKVVKGEGQIKDNKIVFVKNGNEETTITAKNIIIATGSRISQPPIKGIDGEMVINSDQALELEEIPEKLAIIGGGVIGMEFAFIFANFGVEVTVLEFLDEIVAGCDDEICQEMRRIAADKGIEIYTGAKVTSIIESENNHCIVSFEKNHENKYLAVDKVLMAAGREPDLGGLNIEKLGLELNENGRGIKVDEKMATNISGIYAIGDVTNKVLLAHVASHQGIVAVNNILGRPSIMEYSCVPSAIFTEPEIALVGIIEKVAQKEGLEIEVGKFPIAANGKALTLGENRGFIKLIKEKNTGKIIGGAIIGAHATDLIAEVALAIKNELTAEQIIDTIHAHPTTAEIVHEAALACEGGALHFCG